jgi:hypothetical protein
MSRLTCQANLSMLICLEWPVQTELSGCPAHCHNRWQVPDVLSRLYCHGWACHSCLVQVFCLSTYSVLGVIFCLSRPPFWVMPVLSQLSSPAALLTLSCPSFPVPTVLSQLFFPSCSDSAFLSPALFLPAVLSLLSSSHHPILSLLPWMPCLRCPFPAVP